MQTASRSVAEAGTRLSDPGGMQGWVGLLYTEMVYPLTSFMRRTPLTTTPRRQPLPLPLPMKPGYVSWDCGNWKKEGTELTWSSYLKWWRDCLPLLGHIFFKKAEETSTRGHTWKLVKKHCHCDSRLYFLSQRVINRWNNLSQEDVDAQSINCFKNRLEKRRTRQMDFFKDL